MDICDGSAHPDQRTTHIEMEVEIWLIYKLRDHIESLIIGKRWLVPESGVKIAILDLDRFQSVNLAQDVISQIL